MQSMKLILITYATILALGILSIVTKVHYFANIAGFIAAIGFMLVFFKDPSSKDDGNSEVAAKVATYKKYWYVVFATGLFFSLIFGTFWNSQMGGM
ncbi:hypothetical protein [Hydrogenovibrio marinus]|nr:hypothetical protein [Hydrogenovibrio marinus]BBN59268.1 hypothetical protein HVMH_0862 [Hydrogenovibrio marinus]